MYKVIVVGTDGSDRAGVAVSEAFALAKMSGATLHPVHVVRPVSMMGAEHDPAAVATVMSSMHDEGDHICARLRAEAERHGVSAETHNLNGDPAEVLISVAEAVYADLVVVGNRGMTGLKRFVLGSVPNSVSHHCPCSLLIVNTDHT